MNDAHPQRKSLIFVVAYNHEKLIQRTLGRIPQGILEQPFNEILVIDDGSKDRTYEMAQKAFAQLNAKAVTTVYQNPKNLGYGGNQKIGYRYAIEKGFDRVVLLHGDGQYAPELLPVLLDAYESESTPDAVFGTRMSNWKTARKGGMPIYKIVGNKVLTSFQNRLLSAGMSEYHSGYRSYSTELLKSIPFERNSNDFHFDTEIIIQIFAKRAKILEIPIPTHYGDEICNVNGLAYAWNVLLASLHYRLQKLGFLYDRRFDVGDYPYEEKSSIYSSHRRIANQVREGSRVLDLGCGTGQIARQLKTKDCYVHGVDILEPKDSRISGVDCYTRIDLNQDLPALQALVNSETFDTVVIGDLLEHLVEPELFLDTVRGVYRTGQENIVLSTPNVAFLVVRAMLLMGQFNYGPRGILDRTHRRLFTLKSLKRILEQSGYEVIAVEGTPLPLSAMIAHPVIRWIEGLNVVLIRLFPGLFAYQFVVKARALPSAAALLLQSQKHSMWLNQQKSVEHV